jgi:hypothetical protein
MHLIEIFLPVNDNDGRKQPVELFTQVRQELVDRFGGLTAFTRSPAKGLWENDDERHADDIVIYEVMTEKLDPGWWRDYKTELERRFQQEEMMIRSQQVELFTGSKDNSDS